MLYPLAPAPPAPACGGLGGWGCLANRGRAWERTVVLEPAAFMRAELQQFSLNTWVIQKDRIMAMAPEIEKIQI